jgi:mono/diheme cytochrome c family protein
MPRRLPRVALICCLAAGCTAAAGPAADARGGDVDFPVEPGGKEDVFGRRLIGPAAPYQPNTSLAAEEERLRSEMLRRREVAWETVRQVLDPVPLLGLEESAGEHEEIRLPDGEVPRVARWETWYGVDDFKRIFQYLYEGLGAEGRTARAPFEAAAIEEAFEWNATALDRSERWPLERYLKYVNDLGVCPEGTEPDECARGIQSNFSGASHGTARITYSPGTVRHLLLHYPRVIECLERLGETGFDAAPESEDNFSLCFAEEMPADAVLVKAQWVRADFGMDLPVYDTDAESLARILGGQAHWGDRGDRRAAPGPDRVHTIRLRDGSVYRLAGMHIMTKELRHWQWITLWWSDLPDTDFGEDRPAAIREGLPGVWSNYKMCVADWYTEGDPDVARWYRDAPSLAAALQATASGGAPSWCSNPYIEHGRHNARTNCIGCHQHGGSTVMRDRDGDGALDEFDLEAVINDELTFPETGRAQVRELFPADYLWSLTRVDDLAHVLETEVRYFDRIDGSGVDARVTSVLASPGDPVSGAAVFADNCTRCHGPEGEGTDRAPSLKERVPMLDDQTIVRTLIEGRGGMPSWGGTLDDQELRDLLAFLRANAAPATE